MEQTWFSDNTKALSLVIILATIVYTWGRRLLAGRQETQNTCNTLSGIDILQAIGTSKLFPLEHGQTWRLHDFCHDARVWRGHLTTDQSPDQPITLYGCFSKVKGSSQVVLKTIKDLQKYPEWQPQLSKVTQITRAQEAPPLSTRTKATPSVPVQHDYVSLETDETSSRVGRALNHLSLLLRGEPFVRKIINIHRYWHREDNGSCWMLEAPERREGSRWTFYLAQPVEGWFEMDQCLLTIVQAASSPHGHHEAAVAAFRLGALQNYFLYRKVQCTPLNCVTMPSTMEYDANLQEEDPAIVFPAQTSTGFKSISKSMDDLKTLGLQQQSLSESVTSGASSTAKSENSIMKRFRNLIEEKKEWYEERKRKGQDTKGSCSQQGIEQNGAALSAPNRLHEGDSSDSDLGEGIETPRKNSLNSVTTTQDTQPKVPERRKSLLQFFRGGGIGVATQSADDLGSGVEEMTTAPKGAAASHDALSLNLLQRLPSSSDMDTPDGDAGNEAEDVGVEAKEEETEDEKMAHGFSVLANKVAATLVSEKSKVSNIDITLSYDEQAIQTGGWIYCGLEKEVAILRKMIADGCPLQSYLGKGIIPVPPKTVFEAIKNPHTRFTYDEMLKKVEILHDFGNGLKIVYLYHEVSQLFRKEARDFCLLQSERIEGVKYIITMKSVGWPHCPTRDDVTRGKFHSSGWIIEPATRDNKLYSMVTYIVQMELGTSKTNSGYLVEELAAKQPISIANLRYYLAPSIIQQSNQRVGSSSAERKTSAPTVGTLAAAAAFASQGIHRVGALQKSASMDI